MHIHDPLEIKPLSREAQTPSPVSHSMLNPNLDWFVLQLPEKPFPPVVANISTMLLTALKMIFLQLNTPAVISYWMSKNCSPPPHFVSIFAMPKKRERELSTCKNYPKSSSHLKQKFKKNPLILCYNKIWVAFKKFNNSHMWRWKISKWKCWLMVKREKSCT